MELEEGDVVLCTVDRIVGTIVFVKIHENSFEAGKEREGSIIFSEIAPGRIRNIRDYVVPKKKIVCKVLRVSPDKSHIDLSLRRVSQKEKKELLEEYKQEKSYVGVLKSILGDKTNKIIEEIQKKERIYDFLESSKENPSKLEKVVGKESAEKILQILKTQKQKKAVLKKIFTLRTFEKNGINIIKNILTPFTKENTKDKEKIEIKYLSAGKYSLKVESENIKSADNKLKEICSEIEKLSKKYKAEFSIAEK